MLLSEKEMKEILKQSNTFESVANMDKVIVEKVIRKEIQSHINEKKRNTLRKFWEHTQEGKRKNIYRERESDRKTERKKEKQNKSKNNDKKQKK